MTATGVARRAPVLRPGTASKCGGVARMPRRSSGVLTGFSTLSHRGARRAVARGGVPGLGQFGSGRIPPWDCHRLADHSLWAAGLLGLIPSVAYVGLAGGAISAAEAS